jgi:hypothetical protein
MGHESVRNFFLRAACAFHGCPRSGGLRRCGGADPRSMVRRGGLAESGHIFGVIDAVDAPGVPPESSQG